MSDYIYEEEITCIAGEDLILGNVVEVGTDAAVIAAGNVKHPVVTKTGTTGRVLGVTTSSVNSGDIVSVRLWYSGTLSAIVTIDKLSDLQPGLPLYHSGTGTFTDEALGVQIAVLISHAGNPEDDLARSEVLMLRQDIQ